MSTRQLVNKELVAKRFWKKVNVSGPDDCWNWTASTDSRGYGQMNIEKQHWIASRLSWILHHGEIQGDVDAKKILVCHKCDNRRCVNPSHLFLGTAKDNMADMHSKGRARPPRGQDSYRAKLTEEKVIQIRELKRSGVSTIELSGRFGVNPRNIDRIVSRERWAHVP